MLQSNSCGGDFGLVSLILWQWKESKLRRILASVFETPLAGIALSSVWYFILPRSFTCLVVHCVQPREPRGVKAQAACALQALADASS